MSIRTDSYRQEIPNLLSQIYPAHQNVNKYWLLQAEKSQSFAPMSLSYRRWQVRQIFSARQNVNKNLLLQAEKSQSFDPMPLTYRGWQASRIFLPIKMSISTVSYRWRNLNLLTLCLWLTGGDRRGGGFSIPPHVNKNWLLQAEKSQSVDLMPLT